MKYCVHCGAEMFDEAVVCVKCGRAAAPDRSAAIWQEDDALALVIKIFLIIGCISQGWMLIPLAWCVPITVSIFNALRERRPIGTGIKICTLLFVNIVAGVCLLCRSEDRE